jgi:ferredoxin
MYTSDMPAFFIGHIDQDEQQFDAWAHQPLLNSMEQGGINWPSSCRNGTCRTCFSKMTQGKVRYEIEWPGLSADELEAGYVLPCVAYPCSNISLRYEGF